MNIPKPLLPLGEVPVLEIVIQQLAANGFTRIALAINHLAPLFSALLGDGSRWGVKLEYYLEDEPLGTAGSLRLVRGFTENFLVMNGDLLTTLDYRALVGIHESRGAAATIACSQRQVKIDYGVLVSGDDGILSEYREKPTIDYSVSMGIYVLARESLALVPSSGKFDMPELMLALKNAGRPVLCHKSDCYWQDIGRFDDYQHASEDFTGNPGRFLPNPERAGA